MDACAVRAQAVRVELMWSDEVVDELWRRVRRRGVWGLQGSIPTYWPKHARVEVFVHEIGHLFAHPTFRNAPERVDAILRTRKVEREVSQFVAGLNSKDADVNELVASSIVDLVLRDNLQHYETRATCTSCAANLGYRLGFRDSRWVWERFAALHASPVVIEAAELTFRVLQRHCRSPLGSIAAAVDLDTAKASRGW